MKSLRERDFDTMMFLFNTSLFWGRCQELFYEDRHYHEHCFRCFRCDRSLADEPFTSQDEALLCNDCYCNEFSSKCVACDKIVMPGEGSRRRYLRAIPLWLQMFQRQGKCVRQADARYLMARLILFQNKQRANKLMMWKDCAPMMMVI